MEGNDLFESSESGLAVPSHHSCNAAGLRARYVLVVTKSDM